ncbi:hypothetical protein GCM10028805_07860 [Spirosoma harenae]
MRILKIVFSLAFLATLTAQGQAKYRVGLCPGSATAYLTLAKQVSTLPVPKPNSTPSEMEEVIKKNEPLLKKYLTDWVRAEKLTRYQVAIHYPDKKVRFWQPTSGGEGTFFNESVSTAAGRGELNTDVKPGDNQRCFFQDTTVVLDTLHIRLGDFTPATRFALIVDKKSYPLPLNAQKTELLLYASLLPDSPTGRYLPITMTIEDEVRPVTLYFLSPDNRAQLVRSLRAWTRDDQPPCTELPERLVTFLTHNWGGKQCVSPALYHSAQRQVIRNLLRTEHIGCTP